MTGPRPAAGRVGKIAGLVVRGGRRLGRARASEIGELTGCGPVAGQGN
jgi:hypothetical protein